MNNPKGEKEMKTPEENLRECEAEYIKKQLIEGLRKSYERGLEDAERTRTDEREKEITDLKTRLQERLDFIDSTFKGFSLRDALCRDKARPEQGGGE